MRQKVCSLLPKPSRLLSSTNRKEFGVVEAGLQRPAKLRQITKGMKRMKRVRLQMAEGMRGLAALVLLTLSSASAQEQANTSQILTLQVVETNRIDISQKSLTLVINQASLESGAPVEAVNEEGMLVWITNGENKKVTVASNNPSPKFLLKMHALDITGGSGVAASDAILNDNTTKDLISGISKSFGRCKIHLAASAKVGDGIGTETYTLTYTITGG
jgi:hypothetical protein